MKAFFWGTVVAALLSVIVGALAPVPLSPSISAVFLAEWYTSVAYVTAILGALAGVAGGLVARYTVRHRPHESAQTFLGRVRSRGFATQLLAFGLALGWAAYRAFSVPLGPLAPGDQAALLLLSGRIFLPLGAAVLAASLTFVATTYVKAWGGQYAVAPWRRELTAR